MHPEAKIQEVGEERALSMQPPEYIKAYMAVTLSEVSCYVNFRLQNKDCTDPIAKWHLLAADDKTEFAVSGEDLWPTNYGGT